MDKTRAVNIAIDCVIASSLDKADKDKVIGVLRQLEQQNSEVIERFIEQLVAMSGTRTGIGVATIEKIRQFAIREGFLEPPRKGTNRND